MFLSFLFCLSRYLLPSSRFVLEGANNITTYSLLLVSIGLLITRNSSTPENILLAFLMCLSFGTRYIDVFLLSPILAPLIFRIFARQRSMKPKTIVAAILFLTVLLTLLIHHFYLVVHSKLPMTPRLPLQLV